MKTKEQKLIIQQERDALIELLRSGHAALNSKGNIVDRRKVKKIAKAFAKETLLGIPEPVK